MSQVRFIHDGNKIDHTPSPGSNVAAGDVVVQGDLVGIAKLDIPTGTLGALAVTGVFDFPKHAAPDEAIPAGAKVYWDAYLSRATAAAGSNKYLGKTTRAAGDMDATVRVRLDQ